MSTHKLTAGDGYTYLIRQTAAHDAAQRGRKSLGDYYTEKGESPGQWVGKGLASLSNPEGRSILTDKERGHWTIGNGSPVTEEQMKSLFGLGMHPNAAEIADHHITVYKLGYKAALKAAGLGRPFLINTASTELQRRSAVAFRDHNLSVSRPWNAPLDESLRAKLRSNIARELFEKQYERQPLDARELTGFIAAQSRDQTTSTAGYDLTFSPVKSFSVLWALAPRDLSETLAQCHDQAVNDTLEYLQDHAAFTRVGTDGVAQIDTEGLIAARFTHRDSRAGDPDLHTHVAVSNKVRAQGVDGISRWLALDGRPLFKCSVAASEFYNSRLEAHAAELAGLEFEDREPAQRGKRAVREIVGIPAALCDLFAARRLMIRDRYTELAKQFQADHGREPTTPEAIALSQQATLETRTAKHEPRSLAEQRQQWRAQAIEHLGTQQALSTLLVDVRAPTRQAAIAVTDQWIAEQARTVINTVSQARSSWQINHVFAEAQRRVRAAGAVSDRTLADTITRAALQAPLSLEHARLADTDLAEPNFLRRRDGASVYSTHGTQLFTSAEILAAERRILAAAGRTDGRRATLGDVDMALSAEKALRGRTLNPGQEAVVRKMACSGALLQLALAPAGSGKTTAMAALTGAWQESGGRVLGLSPGANQAQLLRDDIDTDTDTVDKFIWLTQHPDAIDDPARSWFDAIDDTALIIVDEAGKAGTAQLDAVITAALARGASVRLVGDDQQLASIAAGGVLRDIDNTYGALNLTEIVRFKSRAEAQAGLALRAGDPTGLAFYADKGRVHVGSDDTIIDMVYRRWAADSAAGDDTLMLAPTNDIVTQLNERARLDRLVALAVDAHHGGDDVDSREVSLGDGSRASVGDIVTTRRNRRRLRISGAGDFVRNGYRWRVQKVHRDGGLTVGRIDTGQRTTLPGWYVRTHVTLGYAATIDSAQGMTVGTRTNRGSCYVVGSERLTRQQLYTAMSRATDESHIFLSTSETDAHRILTPKATHPQTAVDVLQRVLANDGSQVSATTEDRNVADPFQRLKNAADMYIHALGTCCEHQIGPNGMAAIDTGAEEIYPSITDSGGWPTLRIHLARIALAGEDPLQRLQAAVDGRDLDNAADPAAVLDWRLGPSRDRGPGPLQWLPGIPEAFRAPTTKDLSDYLDKRFDKVVEYADAIRDIAARWDIATTQRWARPLLEGTPGIRAEIAVFRAAHGVSEPDTRLTGPEQYPTSDRRAQQLLEQLAAKQLGHRDADTSRFHSLIDDIDPRVRRDPYWPQLATYLAGVARTGVNLRQLISDAATEGPLPDQMPGAALWWRLAGRLQPAALDKSIDYLRPDWLTDLQHVFGTAVAETIAADPAFPRLVAAIDNADPARWTPLDLLHVAAEHLRDVDHDHHIALRPDEYAQLLIYSIDLFASDSPYDHPTIPDPADIPLTPEEFEALQHQIPDPHNPLQPLSDAAVLEILGLGYGGHLIPPAELDFENLPSDPLDADHHRDELSFADLLSERPLLRPIGPANAHVSSLRAEYRSAAAHLGNLDHQIRNGYGPAVHAAMDQIRDMRERADADRPYLLAIQHVRAQWADADAHNEIALANLDEARAHLQALRERTDAEPLDVASAQHQIDLCTTELNPTSPAEQFMPALTQAITARAHAAGGAHHIISGDDVDAYLAELRQADDQARQTARAAQRRLRAQLDDAETAVAQAFAEAETRNADHVLDQLDAIDTELDMLRAAGDYRIERGFTISADNTTHLPDLTARTITAAAGNGFTITALHVDDDQTAKAALRVLGAAADDNDRDIIWCTAAADHQRARLPDTDTAVGHVTLADLHQRVAQGQRDLGPDTTIVIDHAQSADPQALTDLAEYVAEKRARMFLLDGDDPGTIDAPSAPLLKLLHSDLPWSGILTSEKAIARRHRQPDRDAALDQAQRLSPAILPPAAAERLDERQRLRAQHDTSYRVHTQLWQQTHTSDQRRDPGLDR